MFVALRFQSTSSSGCSSRYITYVMALICVSDQRGTSSKKGPHLLFFAGYCFSHFAVMSYAFRYRSVLPVFIAMSWENISSDAVQKVVYDDFLFPFLFFTSVSIPSYQYSWFTNSPVSPVIAFTLKGHGDLSASPGFTFAASVFAMFTAA